MRLLRAIGLSLLFATPLAAANWTVNDLGDAGDAAPGNGICATAGNVCTFRAAVEEANGFAGGDYILFSVSGTITLGSPVTVSSQVNIWGDLAPGFVVGTPSVILDGTSTVANGLVVGAGATNSTIRGLQIRNFTSTGLTVSTNNVGVKFCFLGPGNMDGLFLGGSLNLVGSGSASEGNVASGNLRHGMLVTGTQQWVGDNIVGLTYSGAPLPNGDAGILVFSLASNITIGAESAEFGNVISANGSDGIRVDNASDVQIISNYIGTGLDGTTDMGNGGNGIVVSGSQGVTISGNVVSGNSAAGIDIRGTSSGTVVSSNAIGRTSGSTGPLPNGAEGIVIAGADDNVIGVSEEGNWIGSNTGDGVAVTGSAVNNRIEYNAIFGNGGLGIDLSNDGVTANDPGDADSGPNNLQNYPVLTSATTDGVSTSISGTINTTPSTAVRIFFYGNVAADPSGFGEGNLHVGFTDVVTDASGNAAFTATIPLALAGTVTATATATQNSSEFSGNVTVTAVPSVAFSSATYNVTEGAGTATITLTRTGDLSLPSSVDYATSDAGANAGADYTATSGTANFASGAASATFNVPISADAVDEVDEAVMLALSNPTNATLGAPSTATLTINDDDAAPSITISDVTQAEGDAGTSAFVFTVSLSGTSAAPVTMGYATANGTATAGSDYVATSGSATILPGQTATTIEVLVNGDVAIEPDETFFVNLSNVSNATISDVSGTGTITNDDAAADAAAIPTLGEWMLIALAGMLALFAVNRMR